MRMGDASRQLKASLLSSHEYLEGRNLVKNKILDEPSSKTSPTSNILSSCLVTNKLLKSPIDLSFTSSFLRHYKETPQTADKCHKDEQTKDLNILKLNPIDWLKNAIIQISYSSSQMALDDNVDGGVKRNHIHDNFDDLLTHKCRDTYKQLKINLISCISSSVVTGAPSKEKKILLGQSVRACIDKDPEFILKAALYCRRELNIRTTTNMLLAIASCDKNTRPFISKYFSSCIRTPSDWVEVAEYYAGLSGSSTIKGMSKVLRSSMKSKFLEFDQYQLAKHCRHKARASRSTKSKRQMTDQDNGAVDVDIDTVLYRFTNSPRTYFTIKELIRRLHISKPRFSVMCILGKTYPLDSTDFIRMGLEGQWDSSKAGTRMKLPVPITWETELSINGNNAESWAKLITLNKVPHMALLRNLRNILRSGIPNSIHEIVLKRLTDPRIVIEGKQFPLRYLTAFDTIDRLKDNYILQRSVLKMRNLLHGKCKQTSGRAAKRRDWCRKHAKLSDIKFLGCDIDLFERYKKALSTALELSMRHNLPPIGGSTLIICSTSKYVNPSKHKSSKSYIDIMGFLLGAMCTSICETPTTYVNVDSEYNLTPIEVVFREKDIKNRDDVDSYVYSLEYNEYRSKYKDMGILQRAKQMYKRRSSLVSSSITSVFEKFYAYRKQFDKIVVFGDCHEKIIDYVINYRTYIGPLKAIWGNLSGEDKWPDSCSKNGWIEFKGCTDQILRYIAEPNDDKLLERIEKIDEIYGLNKSVSYHFDVKTKLIEGFDNSVSSKCDYFKSGWRCCQLFISSTFRDMHAERDLLCGMLVPALRTNVALDLRVHLNEIDLRWGIPEPATFNSQALQICLEQAAACDIFILLLGNRYGFIPDEAQVKALPEPLFSEVCKFYKPGMSMTEMEYHMAKQSAMSKVPIRERRLNMMSSHEAIRLRICVFIRDPKSIDYPAQFSGIIYGYPIMGNLEEFGNQFLSSIRSLLLRLYHSSTSTTNNDLPITSNKSLDTYEFLRAYVYSAACSIGPRHLLEVEQAFKSLTERGQQVHLTRAIQSNSDNNNESKVQENKSKCPTNLRDCDGCVLLIVGSSGSGKTTYLSALTISLIESGWYTSSFKNTTQNANDLTDVKGPSCRSDNLSKFENRKLISQRPKFAKHHVLIHFSNGLPVSGLPPKRKLNEMLKNWLRILTSQLDDLCDCNDLAKKVLHEITFSAKVRASESTNSISCDLDLKFNIQCFARFIQFIGYLKDQQFAFLIDDCDQLEPMSLEWLPQILPKNVQFVLTCDTKSSIAHDLSNRIDCQLLAVSGLTTHERNAAVRSLLGKYGKVLNESGFRNQLSILTQKRDANIPLYLKLACDELRLYSTYNQLDEKLKQLPDTISSLVEYVIKKVERECGSDLTRIVLGLIACTRQPLSTEELHRLIDDWLRQSFMEQQNANCSGGYKDPWHELRAPLTFDASSDFDNIMSNESIIRKLLIDRQFNNNGDQNRTSKGRPHLPSLALHILLTSLHPLLSGFGDDNDEVLGVDESLEDSTGATKRQKLTAWNLGSRAISFSSREIQQLVYDICFNRSKCDSRYDWIFRKNSIKSVDPSKRLKSDVDYDGGEIHLKPVTLETIHNILAINLRNMKDAIYHLYHAGRLNTVACLLSSPVFILHQIQSGYGLTLLDDMNTFLVTTSSRHLLISNDQPTELHLMRDKIISMQTFLATNYEFLTQHPSSFAELAINQDADDWIHTIGLVCLCSSNDNEMTELHNEIFFRIKPNKNASSILPKIIQPNAIYKPVTPMNGRQDVPLSIELDRTGNLLAYGTESGTVTVVEVQSFKVLCSFLGHSMPILNLCFLDNIAYEESLIRSYDVSSSLQLWLVSTSQDGSVLIWDISNVMKDVTCYGATIGVSSLVASLSGYHNRPVTVSAWHPRHHLLATGGLDYLMCFWDISEMGFGSYFMSKSSYPGKISPYKQLEITSSINSLAFRLPNYSSHGDDEKSIPNDDLRDVIAIGCWDGFLHIYNVVSMRMIKSLAVSSSAICSLAYSPNGGQLLAILDRKGQSSVLNADTLAYLGRFTENINLSPFIEFSSRDEQYYLLPNQKGKLCFSKPNGQYLIQTGGGSSVGRINVWNAYLGDPEGPWITVSRKKQEKKKTAFVTTYDVDRSGNHIVIGWNDGLFTIVVIKSGNTVFSSDKCIPMINDNSSIQAITCGYSPYCTDTSLLIIGWSSGAVRIYQFGFKPKIGSKRDDNFDVYPELFFISDPNIVHLYTSWSHSIEHTENGTGEAGGTLCVDGYFSVAVSGGGNCEAWVYFLGTDSQNPSVKPVCLRQHSNQITAVAVEMHFIATGSKDRSIAIYGYDGASATVFLRYIMHNAANDWITSLTWSYTLYKYYKQITSLLVGSNDQFIRLYGIKSKKYHLRQIFVSNKSEINSLDFNFPYIFAATNDGHVRVWRYGRHECFEQISDMIISPHLLNFNETRESSVNLFKIRSFKYTPCYDTLDAKTVVKSHSELEICLHKDSVISVEETDNDSPSLLFDHNNVDDTSQHCDITPDENSIDNGVDNNEISAESTLSNMQSFNNKIVETDSDDFSPLSPEEEAQAMEEYNDPFNDDIPTGFQIFDKCVNRPGSIEEFRNSTDLKLLVGQTISLHDIQEFQFRVYEPSNTGYHATLSGHAGLIPCGLSCAKFPDSNDDALLVTVAGENCDSNTIGCDIRLWKLPLSNNSSLCEPIQHTGSIVCAGRLKVTNNLHLCITGSTDGDCIIWAICSSSSLTSHPHLSRCMLPTTAAAVFTWQPLIRLSNSYMKPRYSVNSIVTQVWMDTISSKNAVHYFMYIAYGYEILTLHIHLDHNIIINTNDLENTIIQLFSNKGESNITFVELDGLWSTKTIDGYAEIKKFKSDHVVIQMSAIHQDPINMNQCGVVALLSNGEVIIIPFKRNDDELIRLQVRENSEISNHWCTSICTYHSGILIAHDGSALFHSFDDSARVFTPLPGTINNLDFIYIDSIEPLCIPYGNITKLFYVVTSKLKSEPRIVIFNSDDGNILLDFSLKSMNLEVTAYCITTAYFEGSMLTVHLLLATSDSILRLIKCSINTSSESRSSKWKQIKVYPTGEQVMKLVTLDHKNPVKIMCGLKNGQIDFYTIL
ncbi:Telomerase protein component 1 [Schistosoma japonicum]|nr:Telomerase protein component 1 [Schistosoma japonicum]